jgi:hypothetical protein
MLVAANELILTSPDNGLGHRYEAGSQSLEKNMPFVCAPNDSAAAAGVSFDISSSDCVAIEGCVNSSQSPGELTQLFCPIMSAGVSGQYFNYLDDLIQGFDVPIMSGFPIESPHSSTPDNSETSPRESIYSNDQMVAHWSSLHKISNDMGIISVPEFSSGDGPRVMDKNRCLQMRHCVDCKIFAIFVPTQINDWSLTNVRREVVRNSQGT